MNSGPNDVVGPPESGADRPALYHGYHDERDGEQLSACVVDVIADAADVDPTVTRLPLRDAVDPDALDALFDRNSPLSRGERGYLVFELWDLTVIVHGNGHVIAIPDST